MKIIRILTASLLVLVGVVSTVGSYNSGGGSGGIGGGLGPIGVTFPVPQPDTDITSTNAQEVGATVVQAFGQLFDLTTVIGGQVFPSPPSAPDLLPGNSKFEFLATGTAPGPDPCTVSGTFSIQGRTYNDPVNPKEGDTFGFEFDSCDDGYGYTLDGSFTLIVSELDGDPQTDVFRIVYKLNGVSITVTSGIDTYVASDPQIFLIGWESFAFPVVVLTTSPGALDLTSQMVSWPYWQAGVHSLTVNADISIPATQATASESLIESAALGGSLSYEIIIPLQSPDGQVPESGEILISGGDGNGTIRIVIESSSNVRLEIDADDDGTVENYQYTTWAALRG
jgi:hypothetical protein